MDLRLCVCVFVCVCVCVCVRVHTVAGACMRACVSVYVCVHLCVCVRHYFYNANNRDGSVSCVCVCVAFKCQACVFSRLELTKTSLSVLFENVSSPRPQSPQNVLGPPH